MSRHVLAPGAATFFDGLRFVLAQVVVVGHGFGYFMGYWNGFFPSRFPHIQSIAVVGFFFVSGFLITNSVIIKWEHGRISLASYLIDRFSRIYCTLVPCLVFVVAVDAGLRLILSGYEFGSSLTLSVAAKNLLLIPGLPIGSMRPIWSLMFEWWIYIFFGGIIFLARSRALALVCVTVGAYYTLFVNGRGEAGHLELIWAAGAVSAFYFERVARIPISKPLAAACVLCASAALYSLTLDAYNLFAGGLFSVGLLFLVAHSNTRAAPSSGRAATWKLLAGYSFTLFLVHYTVLYWTWLAGMRGVSGFVLSLCIANAIAIMLASVTERHHKRVARWIGGLVSPGGARHEQA